MLVGLLGAGALLLGAAGVLKLVSPDATVRAVIAMEMPGSGLIASNVFIRLFGAGEAGLAAIVLIVGGRWPALLLALHYLILSLVAARLVRHAPGQSCGCFARSTEPVTSWHLGVDLVAAAVAMASSCWPQQSLIGDILRQGVLGFATTAGVVVLAWLGYLMMTALPTLLALAARVAVPPMIAVPR